MTLALRAGGDDRDGVDHQRGAGAGRRLLDHVQRRRAGDHRADEGQQQERQGVRALGLADERELAQQVVEQQGARGRDLLRSLGRPGPAAARSCAPARTAAGWPGGSPASVISVRVAAEHRRGDDAGEHRQSGIGRGEDVLQEHRRRVGRHQVAVRGALSPVDQLGEDVPEAILGHGPRHRTAIVVPLDPGRPAAAAVEPGRAVSSEQQAPGAIGKPGEVAIVGAHLRKRRGRAVGSRAADVCRCSGSAVRDCCPLARRRLPFGRGLDHRADPSAPSSSSRSLKSSPASGGWAIQTRRPSAWNRSAARSRDLEAGALAIMVSEEDDPGNLGRQHDLFQIARGERRPDRQCRAGLR